MQLERGLRSSLRLLKDGTLEREYHDTGARVPVAPRVDGAGVARVGANRSVDGLVEAVLDRTYRGPHTAAPPFIVRAYGHLRDGVADVDELARRCGVARATAWQYASTVLQWFPDAREAVAALAYPPLHAALAAVDATGPLRDVMQRVNAGPLRGDVEWKEVSDRHAHLRVARLCCAV